jgi:hypothetical protein
MHASAPGLLAMTGVVDARDLLFNLSLRAPEGSAAILDAAMHLILSDRHVGLRTPREKVIRHCNPIPSTAFSARYSADRLLVFAR